MNTDQLTECYGATVCKLINLIYVYVQQKTNEPNKVCSRTQYIQFNVNMLQKMIVLLLSSFCLYLEQLRFGSAGGNREGDVHH